MERVRIGLVGFGTVGESFYTLLVRNADELARKIGAAIEVPYVGVRDVKKKRAIGSDTTLVSGYQKILEDPTIPIIVELAGGIEAPLALIREALARGKHVITANKALLALHGKELFETAAAKGVELKFEASVCGGIPIVKVLRESLLGNRINSILGIVNGTTNYILTRMTEEKIPLAEALRQAQEQGFAEADPTLDLDGSDAAQKISLLASLAFGCWIDYRQVYREGIGAVGPEDITFCMESGFMFKLVAQARMVGARPLVCVYPTLVPLDHPLAGVRNEFNGVLVDSDFLGPSVYEGRGAGGHPTASSVASDLGDLVKTIIAGQPRKAPAAELLGPGAVSVRIHALALLLPFRDSQPSRHMGPCHEDLRGQWDQHRVGPPEVGGQVAAIGPLCARGRGR